MLGGPGTGKTVVALHRAQWLAKQNPKARLLLTTFTTTMAAELSALLRNLAGPFPGDLQQNLVFTAAVAGNAKGADAAKAFIDFLKTPAAAAVFKAKGVTPG